MARTVSRRHGAPTCQPDQVPRGESGDHDKPTPLDPDGANSMAIDRRSMLLVLLLSITLAGDTLFMIGLIWTVVDRGYSTVLLGVVLALTAVLPHAVQWAVPKLRSLIASHPEPVFTVVRAVGVGIALAAVLLRADGIHALFGLAAAFSVLFFLSLQVLEVMIAVGVLGGRMTAHYGARLLQTAIQIGAFGGAAMAGVALHSGGMIAVLATNAVTMAVGGLGVALLARAKPAGARRREDAGAGEPPDPAREPGTARSPAGPAPIASEHASRVVRWTATALLVAIMIQLSAFNFLFPIIANRVHGWSAMQFGLLDAVAGAAAFAAVIIGERQAARAGVSFVACVAIGVFNVSLALVAHPIAVLPAVAIGAFLVTLFRIRQHGRLYEAYSDAEQAARWSSHLVLGLTLSRALVPLVLGAAAELLAAPALMILVGAALVAATLTLLVRQLASAPLDRALRTPPSPSRS